MTKANAIERQARHANTSRKEPDMRAISVMKDREEEEKVGSKEEA